MNILEEIKKLNLPPNEYVILGSGILAVKDIRTVEDIDLLVTPQIFESLRHRGWKYEVVQLSGKDRERVSSGVFEAFEEFWQGETVYDFKNNPEWVEVIDGIMFMSLQELLKIKRIWNRDKDQKDIKLIEKYLKQESVRR